MLAKRELQTRKATIKQSWLIIIVEATKDPNAFEKNGEVLFNIHLKILQRKINI